MTDDERRIFVPNTQLTTTPILNRTIRDPRLAIVASLPVRLGAPLEEAQRLLLSAAESTPGVTDQKETGTD